MYIEIILKKFSILNSKRSLLPVRHGILGPNKDKERRQKSLVPYAIASGCLMYAILCTQSDVSCAVCDTGKHQPNLIMEHWILSRQSIKCLRSAKDVCLMYGKENLRNNKFTNLNFS